MSNILFEFTIDAPVSKVYRAISKADGVKGWWTTDTTLASHVGGAAEFGFGPRGSLKFEVTELVSDNRVAWKTVQAMPDWDGTRVTFDLEAEDGGTKVLFGHRDFATEEGSFASSSFNWAHFMMSLKGYVESGQGMPVGA